MRIEAAKVTNWLRQCVVFGEIWQTVTKNNKKSAYKGLF